MPFFAIHAYTVSLLMPRCSAISSTDNQRSGVVDISIFGFCKVCSGCFTPTLAATIYSQLDTNSADAYQLELESALQKNSIRNARDPRAYFGSPFGALPVFLLTQPSGRCQLKAPQGLLVPSIAEKRRCGRYPPPSLYPPERIACWRPTPTTIISKAKPMPARMGPSHHQSGFQTPRVVTGSLLTVTTPVARPSALSTTVTCASDAAQ